jgi:hypothetical protein
LIQLGAPHSQNFEIPLKTQESKNFEISFENFQKMLDGSKFGKKYLLGNHSVLFRIWKTQNFFNLEFFLKKVKNLSKAVWVQARELKFCMVMLC